MCSFRLDCEDLYRFGIPILIIAAYVMGRSCLRDPISVESRLLSLISSNFK